LDPPEKTSPPRRQHHAPDMLISSQNNSEDRSVGALPQRNRFAQRSRPAQGVEHAQWTGLQLRSEAQGKEGLINGPTDANLPFFRGPGLKEPVQARVEVFCSTPARGLAELAHDSEPAGATVSSLSDPGFYPTSEHAPQVSASPESVVHFPPLPATGFWPHARRDALSAPTEFQLLSYVRFFLLALSCSAKRSHDAAGSGGEPAPPAKKPRGRPKSQRRDHEGRFAASRPFLQTAEHNPPDAAAAVPAQSPAVIEPAPAAAEPAPTFLSGSAATAPALVPAPASNSSTVPAGSPQASSSSASSSSSYDALLAVASTLDVPLPAKGAHFTLPRSEYQRTRQFEYDRFASALLGNLSRPASPAPQATGYDSGARRRHRCQPDP
jgi:hypothetical protein